MTEPECDKETRLEGVKSGIKGNLGLSGLLRIPPATSAFRFRGQIPVTAKPDKIFLGVIAFIHASPNNLLKSYLVMDLPGCLTRKEWQVSFHMDLSGPNTPLSSGWVWWVVLGGRVNTITLSSDASLMVSGQ